MFTYNTMQTFLSVLGMEPLHMVAPPSDDLRRSTTFPDELVECIVTMTDAGIRPRDIVTPAALRNALTVTIAMGGSTNVALHSVEIARAAGLDLWDDVISQAEFNDLARRLPGEVAVQPTHGFGSFCSSTEASGVDASTIAAERSTNVALTVDDEDRFVEQLMSGLTAYPRYYAHMGARNRQGPSEVDLSPPTRVDPVELRRRIHAGDWVVDLRARRAFALSHLAGTVNVELDDKLPAVVDPQHPLALVTERDRARISACRDLEYVLDLA